MSARQAALYLFQAQRANVNSFPTATVTFLSTDIEESTGLVRQPRERYEEVLAEHRRLLGESFERHRGDVVDTQGDAFFVAFERAGDALASALAAKASLDRHEWPDGAKVHVRFGLHTSEALLGSTARSGSSRRCRTSGGRSGWS
ncbi:MAG: hypothetical protein ACM3QU_08305 [Verrucomicrobiota bacterium]